MISWSIVTVFKVGNYSMRLPDPEEGVTIGGKFRNLYGEPGRRRTTVSL
jgi:hypothetical protein